MILSLLLALPADTYVVAIGNNHGAASETPLLFAESDAQAVASVLRAHGGVSSERVRVIVGEDVDVVRHTLITINAALRAKPAALVVFYSGHADAEALHLGNTRMALDELRAMVEGSPAALRILVLDACRSGTVTRVKGVTLADEFVIEIEDKAQQEGLAIIASSAAGESSQEADRLRASFFTHHFVNALRGAADADGDGQVTLSEAYAYAYTRTLSASKDTLTLQHPTYAYDVKGRSEVVLTSPSVGKHTARLKLGAPATYVVSEGSESGQIVAEVAPMREGAILALPRGRYFVQRREPRAYYEYFVQLEENEELALANVQARKLRYDQLVRKRGGQGTFSQGVMALGGVRGGALAGEAVLGEGSVGYVFDLPWLTLALRVRVAGGGLAAADRAIASSRSEIGAGIALQHFFDLRWLSLAVGLGGEGLYSGQRVQADDRATQAGSTAGASLYAFAALERSLWEGLGMRIEGGPVAVFYPTALVVDGAVTGQRLSTTFSGYINAGPVWRW